jgi:uncharacterized membrane protein
MQKPSATSVLLATSAFTALLALPLLANAAPAPTPSFQAEKCYGVSAGGKNDCASSTNNSCAGQASRAGDPKSWIYVPVGTCSKIQGGSVTPKA